MVMATFLLYDGLASPTRDILHQQQQQESRRVWQPPQVSSWCSPALRWHPRNPSSPCRATRMDRWLKGHPTAPPPLTKPHQRFDDDACQLFVFQQRKLWAFVSHGRVRHCCQFSLQGLCSQSGEFSVKPSNDINLEFSLHDFCSHI